MYVFCITEGLTPPDVESGLETVTYGDLHAVAGPVEAVGLEPGGHGELLPRHDQVVRGLFAEQNVLPVRSGSGVTDPESLRRYLREEYSDLKARLALLRDHEEWCVRWEPPQAGSKEAVRDRVRFIRREVERVHSLLARQATAVCPGASSSGEIAWAYLVPQSEAETFLLMATILDDELTGRGISMQLTGPGPGYSFAVRPQPEISP